MARTPKSDSTPKPRPSRVRSGKPAPPPVETGAGTPGTRDMDLRGTAGGFGEAPQARYAPSPRERGEGWGEGRPQAPAQGAAPHPDPLPMKDGERGRSRIKTEYEPVQPTYAQQTARPGAGSRIKKPSLDDMGPGTDRPVPARAPNVDPRTKAGAFGERISGPHKPTLDEMGPHASLPVKSGKQLPQKPQLPTRTIELEESGEKSKRRGRTKKTGRPGQ